MLSMRIAVATLTAALMMSVSTLSMQSSSVAYASSNTTNTMSASNPSALVLNQSNANGVPMIAEQNNNWPSIESRAAVVMDMNTGTIVYGKNPLEAHYPASITKIMTAMIALQHGKLTDQLTASKNAVNQPSDKLYMRPGEVHSLQSLLYALLLDSANDAAVEIAENYGGSVENFAKMMNQEAASLGATHTHFDNPNGLPDPNHVTTAYDMALMTRAAMQIPEFRQIVKTKMYHWKGTAWESDLWNLNKMLFYYPGAIGVKTGFTSAAHETLVVAATRGSHTFLAVLMDNPTDYSIRHDASQLLDFAFAHYDTETVLQKGTLVKTLTDGLGHKVQVVTDEPVMATIPIGHPMKVESKLMIHAPESSVPKGTVIGYLDWTSQGKVIGRLPVSITRSWAVPQSLVRKNSKWVVGGGATGVCLAGAAITWTRFRRRKRSPYYF